jgi:MFS transporter, AAHS family, benzoate transport protein
LLLGAGLGVSANFLVFAVAAGVAGAVLLACPRPNVRAAAPAEGAARA